MQNILTIDPSLTGTGIWTPAGTRRIDTTKLSGVERLSHLKSQVRILLQDLRPRVVIIEGYSYGNSSNKGSFQLAEWGGVLRLLIHEWGCPLVEVPPHNLKKWVTGKGGARKEAVISEISCRSGLTFPDSDQADAYALAAMAHDRMGDPFFPMPQDRRAAFEKIKWPEWMCK